MIKLESLNKHYKMGDTVVRALDGISLTIEEGESVALLGPSGSGKSTMLHLIGGLDVPTSGTVEVAGKKLSDLDSQGLAEYRQTTVGFVFQTFFLQPHLTTLENVELPLKLASVPRALRAKAALCRLEEVGLADRTDHLPSELSGGQCQRVAIARALANDPKILFADEPTGNLDTATGEDIIQLFMRLNKERGLTVIVVTHDISLAERLDRVVRIRDGKIIEDTGASRPQETETTDASR